MKAIALRLKEELSLDPGLDIPAALTKILEMLGIERRGPLLAQASWIDMGPMEEVRQRVRRVQKELSLASSLSIMATIAQANKVLLGAAQQGPLPRQLDRLYKVIGLTGGT